MSALRRRWRWTAIVAGLLIVAGLALVWQRHKPPAQVLTAAPISPDTQLLLDEIRRLQEHQEYEKALVLTREHLTRDPAGPYLHYSAGVVLGLTRDRDGAIREFNEEIKVNPAFHKAYNGLGMMYSEQGDIDAALSGFKRSLELNPGQPEISFAVGQLLIKQGHGDQAEKYMRAGLDSGYAEAPFQLGLYYLRSGDIPQALQLFRRALAIDPKHLGALLNIGQTLKRMGRTEEGDQFLEHHAELARIQDEIDNFKNATQIQGAGAGNFASLGDANVKHKNYAAAAAAYERAARMSPREARYCLALAAVYSEVGQVETALRWVTRTLELDPGNPSALFILGTLRVRQGRTPEALPLFEQSERRGRWSAQSFRELGMAYLFVGDFTQALIAFELAVHKEPENAAGWHWLGVTRTRQKPSAEAKAALEQASRLDPKDDQIYMALGVLNAELGDRPAAEAAFRQAIRLQRVTLFTTEAVERMLAGFGNSPGVRESLQMYRDLRSEVAEPLAPGAAGSPTPAAIEPGAAGPAAEPTFAVRP